MGKSMDEKAEFLEEMSHYENTEVGETWAKLASLYERYDTLGEKLQDALVGEIESTYQFILDNYELKEKEQTKVFKSRVKYLVWRTDL